MSDTQVGYLLHGRTPQLTATQPSQMLTAAMGATRQLGESPRMGGLRRHRFPQLTQSVVDVPGLSKARNIALDEFHPMMERGQTSIACLFGHKALDRMPEDLRRKFGQYRRTGGSKGPPTGRGLVSDPDKIPPMSGNCVKRAKHVGRRETRLTGAAALPATVEPDTPFTPKACQEVAARQVGPHHGVRFDRLGQAHVGDLIRHQRRATRRPQDSLLGARSRCVRFNQRWVAHDPPQPCGTGLQN